MVLSYPPGSGFFQIPFTFCFFLKFSLLTLSKYVPPPLSLITSYIVCGYITKKYHFCLGFHLLLNFLLPIKCMDYIDSISAIHIHFQFLNFTSVFFLGYCNRIQMCKTLPSASNSNSFLTLLPRLIIFSLTHTLLSIALHENLLSCPKCPSVNNILFSGSRYHVLWSVVSDLNHPQSVLWYPLCPHDLVILFLLAGLSFPSSSTL